MSNLTKSEIQFYVWATKTPCPLPKLTWEELPQWLESHKDFYVREFAPVVESLLEEFPEDFDAEKKATKKAVQAWYDSCQQAFKPTPEDDAAWNGIVELILPYWEEVWDTSYDKYTNTRYRTRKLGWRCTAPAEIIERAVKLWKKTSYSQEICAQCPVGSGVYGTIPQPRG